jgi:hypothetical protein
MRRAIRSLSGFPPCRLAVSGRPGPATTGDRCRTKGQLAIDGLTEAFADGIRPDVGYGDEVYCNCTSCAPSWERALKVTCWVSTEVAPHSRCWEPAHLKQVAAGLRNSERLGCLFRWEGDRKRLLGAGGLGPPRSRPGNACSSAATWPLVSRSSTTATYPRAAAGAVPADRLGRSDLVHGVVAGPLDPGGPGRRR